MNGKNVNKQMNMLEGSIWDKILLFALPLAASSFLQQMLNSADSAVVGRFAGSLALAAVGSNNSFINLTINLFTGLSIGANVIIARSIGANEPEKTKKAVHTSISLALVSGIFLTIFGEIITPQVLHILSVPDDIFPLSMLYLRIYFLGMPFMMLYNFSASVLRSIGDTKRPVIYITFAGIINVILNLILVVVFHFDVAGVAIATVISNVISSMLMMRHLTTIDSVVHVDLKELGFDLESILEIARIGIPAGIQSIMFSLSNVVIQSSVNSLGSTIVAASTLAFTCEGFAFFLENSFNQAATTFVGQNYGAKNLPRCVKVTRWALVLGWICTGTLSILMLTFAHPICGLFTTNPDVIHYAVLRLRYIISFELVYQIVEVLSGTMRGYGRSVLPAVITAIGVCGFRVLYVFTVFSAKKTFAVLMITYPASWFVTIAIMIPAYFILKRRILN